ncbi:hypothetical protein CHS0354_012899 [Potamilus streckersoni]|uniref:Uncharacterized protein n=1 Tax=Potamilus streckersoni TaxID=2493646 RepID=A0AAE0SBV2_9BIVA|nr:hypothetical protein CHS0354_012899 [Potamilus streckersoni]
MKHCKKSFSKNPLLIEVFQDGHSGSHIGYQTGTLFHLDWLLNLHHFQFSPARQLMVKYGQYDFPFNSKIYKITAGNHAGHEIGIIVLCPTKHHKKSFCNNSMLI